jgi:hypothetical protein
MYVSKFGSKAGAAQEAGAFDTHLGLDIPFAAARLMIFLIATDSGIRKLPDPSRGTENGSTAPA